jgi:hypothetical protein
VAATLMSRRVAASQEAVLPFRQMNIEHILALLISERDKLNRAIEALGVPAKRRGRPPKNPFAAAVPAQAKTTSKRRGLSPAKRKAQSERMKAYWAKRKKQTAKG